jgi:hypothetical protein
MIESQISLFPVVNGVRNGEFKIKHEGKILLRSEASERPSVNLLSFTLSKFFTESLRIFLLTLIYFIVAITQGSVFKINVNKLFKRILHLVPFWHLIRSLFQIVFASFRQSFNFRCF